MEKYYVSGCKDNGSETVTCDDSEAQFWTLYVRDEEGLSQGIIDCVFREDAEAAMTFYVERERDELRLEIARIGGAKAIEVLRRDAAAGEPLAFTSESEISNMRATGLYLRGFPTDRRINTEEGYTVPLYTTPPAASVPDGYRVVPIVPTAEMLRVGGNVYEYCEENGEYRDDAARGIYSIMIAAAPAPGGDHDA